MLPHASHLFPGLPTIGTTCNMRLDFLLRMLGLLSCQKGGYIRLYNLAIHRLYILQFVSQILQCPVGHLLHGMDGFSGHICDFPVIQTLELAE